MRICLSFDSVTCILAGGWWWDWNAAWTKKCENIISNLTSASGSAPPFLKPSTLPTWMATFQATQVHRNNILESSKKYLHLTKNICRPPPALEPPRQPQPDPEPQRPDSVDPRSDPPPDPGQCHAQSASLPRPRYQCVTSPLTPLLAADKWGLWMDVTISEFIYSPFLEIHFDTSTISVFFLPFISWTS